MQTSLGYTPDRTMFVCALLASPAVSERRAVEHFGSIVVARDPALVCPLFGLKLGPVQGVVDCLASVNNQRKVALARTALAAALGQQETTTTTTAKTATLSAQLPVTATAAATAMTATPLTTTTAVSTA